MRQSEGQTIAEPIPQDNDDALDVSLPTVCAVVLTFNRVERLKDCITGISNQSRQPDMTLIVDNDSSDGTGEYLAGQASENTRLQVLSMPDNLGPAGGFAAGISWALDNNYDYVWLCDDDSVPDPKCLEYQLDKAEESQRRFFVLSENVDEKGNSSFHAAWRGVLVPSSAIRIAGIPNKDYFFSKEDSDWYWRLAAAGTKRLVAKDAVVRFWQFHQSKKATWKYYYWSRNTIHYRTRVQKSSWHSKRFGKMIVSIARLALRIALMENRKPTKAKYLALGIWHGIKGQMGKNVDPSSV